MSWLWSKDKKVLSPVLINPGATDPRISVFQVLFRTPEFHQAVERKKSNSHEWDLKHVFDDLQFGRSPQLKYDCKHHDAAEHMEQLLKDLSGAVSQPFRGTLVCSDRHCLSEMSQFVTLPLPFTSSVEKGLQQMFDCNSTCETKAAVVKQDGLLKDKQKTPPQILVFHLKRFDLKTSHVKSDCEVELTETLQTQGHSFSLWAVVDHWDSVRDGFYTATISEDGKWYRFGDDKRKRTEPPAGQKSSTAVLIIYRRNEETREFHRTHRDNQGWKESGPYYGLINQGATCYLNSVLQVLFMTPEFRKALDKPSNQTDNILKRLFDKLQSGLCGTESITRNLQAPNTQRCAAEYLEILLNRVSADVSKPFHGELLDITLCSKQHCINQEMTKFWTLPLSMELISSVADGFEKFFEPKTLRGIHCNECEKEGRTTTEAISKYEMAKPPQILVLLIKRFNIDPRTGYNYKSQCEIEIPGTLPTEGFVYSLCGIVNHSGGLGGGHYTATIQSIEDGHWYHFDDTHVRPVQVPYNRSSSAYLLIYRAIMSETGTKDKTPSRKKSSSRGKGQTTLEKPLPPASHNAEDLMEWESGSEKPKAPVQKDRSTEEHKGPGHQSRFKEEQKMPMQRDRLNEEHRGSGYKVQASEAQRQSSHRSGEEYKGTGHQSRFNEEQKVPMQRDRLNEEHRVSGHKDHFGEEQRGAGYLDRSSEGQRQSSYQDSFNEGLRGAGNKDQPTEVLKVPGQKDWTNEEHRGEWTNEANKGSWDKDRSSVVRQGSWDTDRSNVVSKGPGHKPLSNEGRPGHREWFGNDQRATQHKDLPTEGQGRPGHREWPSQGHKGQGYNESRF